jgi:hypothetical protein
MTKIEKEIINIFNNNNYEELTISHIFDNIKDKFSFDNFNNFAELIITICDKLVNNNILNARFDNELLYYSKQKIVNDVILLENHSKIVDDDISLEIYDSEIVDRLIKEYREKNDYDNLELLFKLKYYQMKKNDDLEDLKTRISKLDITTIMEDLQDQLADIEDINISLNNNLQQVYERLNDLKYSLVSTNILWFFLFMIMWFFN